MKNTLVLLSLSTICLNLTTAASAQQFVSSQKVASMTYAAPIFGTADLNKDGRLDFVTGNNVMLKNSNGTFTAKQYAPAPSSSSLVSAVADINGDGKADIVTVNSAPADDHGDPISPPTLTIYQGNGDGTFTAKTPYNLAGGVLYVFVLVSDVNHDGKPDIVTVSNDQYGDASLQTFLNAGSGNFTAGPIYGGGLILGQLFGAADFNGDGFPDLAVRNDTELQILIGKGDGSFTAGNTYNVGTSVAAIGDFNKDGHQDIVAIGQSGTILLGQGNGSFTTGAALNTSFFTNVATAPSQLVAPVGVSVLDLNKDGKLDIAVTTSSSTLVVATYLGNGNGTFSSPKAFNITDAYGPSQLDTSPSVFADFNNDGKIDVIAEAAGTGVSAFASGDGSGGFKAPVISQTPDPGSIVTADFNHDGIQDVAVVNEPLCSGCATKVTVFPGTGKNYFGAPVTYTIPVTGGMIAAGDVNNDGRMDLVVAGNPQITTSTNTSNQDVAVLLGRGDGTFDAAVGYHLLGAPKAGTQNDQVYLVDVNKDGKLDLIGDWGVALGKGNGQFGTPIALPSTITSIVALAPGDFNNTGTIGLAVATNTYDAGVNGYTAPYYLYVLAGSNNGSFRVISQKSVPAYITKLITADMNGDHRSDILYTTVNGAAPPQLTLGVQLSVTGNYGFSEKDYTIAAPSVTFNSTIVTADFNKDGKIDVAIPGIFQSAGDLALLAGTGGGALSSTPTFYQGSMGQAVILDVNGDGFEDLVGATTIGVARLLNAQ